MLVPPLPPPPSSQYSCNISRWLGVCCVSPPPPPAPRPTSTPVNTAALPTVAGAMAIQDGECPVLLCLGGNVINLHTMTYRVYLQEQDASYLSEGTLPESLGTGQWAAGLLFVGCLTSQQHASVSQGREIKECLQ